MDKDDYDALQEFIRDLVRWYLVGLAVNVVLFSGPIFAALFEQP